MGQKIHPTGFRLSVSRNWASRWYANNRDFAGMLADLNAAAAGTIVVLHACCHNPTGVDLLPEDWKQILDVLRAKDHVPFIDIAYQGFGDGIEEDAFEVEDSGIIV